MSAPSDTFIQSAAQALGGSGLAVAILIALTALAIAFAICLIGLWREIKKGEAQLQRDLERATERERGRS